MVEQFAYGKRKTRKPHQCFECFHAIPTGTVCDYQTNCYDGRAYTLYSHSDCSDLAREWRALQDYYYEDGYQPLQEEWAASGEYEKDCDAWRGFYPHAVTRLAFWFQDRP